MIHSIKRALFPGLLAMTLFSCGTSTKDWMNPTPIVVEYEFRRQSGVPPTNLLSGCLTSTETTVIHAESGEHISIRNTVEAEYMDLSASTESRRMTVPQGKMTQLTLIFSAACLDRPAYQIQLGKQRSVLHADSEVRMTYYGAQDLAPGSQLRFEIGDFEQAVEGARNTEEAVRKIQELRGRFFTVGQASGETYSPSGAAGMGKRPI